LQIDIEHPIIKFINFTLEKKKSDINTQVTELSSYVYETLANKIKSLEEKNKEYENEIQEMKSEYEQKFQKLIEINKKNENKIIVLEETIKDIKNELNFHKENVGKQLNVLSINSNKARNSIFNSKIKINESLVKSWLNNRNFTANLLFRMSENGKDFKTFHQKCDNKGTTITFIETMDGLLFGGYTELEWDSFSRKKYDIATFIFSFNTNEKYTKRNNNYSISCLETTGPVFGWGPQIDFKDDLSNGRSFLSDGSSFVLNNKFTLGKANWTTKELEIYQIKYL
jgi:hypothetical protein